jgi:hypothetical protein
MTSPKAVQERRFVEHAGRTMRRKGIAKATKPEDEEFIRGLHEALAAQRAGANMFFLARDSDADGYGSS